MFIGMPILYEYNSLEENIKLAKNLGLDFVELNLNFDYCRQEMEQGIAAELLKKYELMGTLHFYDEADFATYPEIVKAYFGLLKKYIKLGKNYLKNINIHLNVGPIVTIAGVKNYLYEKEYDTYIERLTKNLKKVETYCKKYNIQMVLENVVAPKFIVRTFSDLAKKGFVFNYDAGHDNNDDYHIRDIHENLIFKEMHIHDGNGKTCHLAIGDGEMDIKYFKDIAIKNDAFVVIEVKSSKDLIKSIPIYKSI